MRKTFPLLRFIIIGLERGLGLLKGSFVLLTFHKKEYIVVDTNDHDRSGAPLSRLYNTLSCKTWKSKLASVKMRRQN